MEKYKKIIAAFYKFIENLDCKEEKNARLLVFQLEQEVRKDEREKCKIGG